MKDQVLNDIINELNKLSPGPSPVNLISSEHLSLPPWKVDGEGLTHPYFRVRDGVLQVRRSGRKYPRTLKALGGVEVVDTEAGSIGCSVVALNIYAESVMEVVRRHLLRMRANTAEPITSQGQYLACLNGMWRRFPREVAPFVGEWVSNESLRVLECESLLAVGGNVCVHLSNAASMSMMDFKAVAHISEYMRVVGKFMSEAPPFYLLPVEEPDADLVGGAAKLSLEDPDDGPPEV
jgi:hypothetical protein